MIRRLVVFDWLSPDEGLRIRGRNWENRSIWLRGITTNYPLVVAGYGGSRLRIELTYDRRRFNDETILGIKNRLQIVLEEIASDPARILAELPMTSPREKRELVFDWNATTTTIPRDVSVAGLFEAQTERTPENTSRWSSATGSGRMRS